MANQKNKGREKKIKEKSDIPDHDHEQPSGYGSSGGNMGAGKSGKEDMGSEKPTDDRGMGSEKPSGSSA